MCLVVMGKYVPGVEFVATLMANSEPLGSDMRYYQRLLAGDHAEAAELIEQRLKEDRAETIYDGIVIPALNYAERDRIEGRLSIDEEQRIVEATHDLLDDASELPSSTPGDEDADQVLPAARPTAVLGWAAHGASDALALRMLGSLLEATPIAFETLSSATLIADGVRTLEERGCRIVCIADLPPRGPSKSRHLVKRLRAAVPGLAKLVGRWAPPMFGEESAQLLQEAGADHVGTTLLETRERL